MCSLYVRGAFARTLPLLELFKRPTPGACAASTWPPDGEVQVLTTLRTSIHYSVGYSSRIPELFEFQVRKDVIAVPDCSLTRCHFLHRPA